MSDASDRLLVEINRTGMRSLEVPDSVTVDRSFTVDLRNHGQDTHVHLHLDDALSEVARLGTDNHHVPGGSRRPVPVHVSRPDGYEPVSGRLKVAIAYGQETEYIDITVDVDEPVTVDPELSQPTGAAADGAGRLRRWRFCPPEAPTSPRAGSPSRPRCWRRSTCWRPEAGGCPPGQSSSEPSSGSVGTPQSRPVSSIRLARRNRVR